MNLRFTNIPDNLLKAIERHLTPREEDVFLQRCTGLTYQKIADHYGVTRERITQIHRKSIEKLLYRYPSVMEYPIE